MRRRNRRQITEGQLPSPPPRTDALGACTHTWQDTNAVSIDRAYSLVSPFCGAGGIDIGFHAAGFRTLLAVETDEDAGATYQSSFPYVDLVLSDIRDLTDEEVVARLGGVEVDVLAAGWPCQGMSPAGAQDPLDPRNHLYLEVIRFARLLRPKVIVLENVPDLLRRKFRHLLDDLLARLDDAGYPNASVMVLDAVDYGVPQHRERVITVANRLGRSNPYPLPLPLERYVTVRDTITDLADSPDDLSLNHIRIRHSAERAERFGCLGPGESLNGSHSLSARRLIAEQPANTVLWGHGTLMVHPWLHRTLTVREAARLQGIPDDHLFLGRQGAQGSQVGNAVPPPLARCLALALRPMLDLVMDESLGADRAGRPIAMKTAGIDWPPSSLIPVEANHHVPHLDLPVSHIIEGDNLQVMEALLKTHAGRVDAIWADPPYNTGTSQSYRNSFDRGQWARDLADRLTVAKQLLTEDGVICMTIDHFELFALGELMETVFGRQNRLGIVTVVHNPRGRTAFAGGGFSEVNEYYLFYARNVERAKVNPQTLAASEMTSRFPKEDQQGHFAWDSLVRTGGRSRPNECPDQYYPIHADAGTGRMDLRPFEGSVTILPVDEEGQPRIWRCVSRTFDRWADDGLLRLTRSECNPSGHTIQKKRRPNGPEGDGHFSPPKTVWSDPTYDATTHGSKLLRRMIGPNPFSYPKSVYAVREALRAMVGHKPKALVLDLYAGSGTTGHALLMMNADDGGRRSFLLVNSDEAIRGRGGPMVRICEDICLPRVRAAIDGYEYRRGRKTHHVPGLPGNVQYLRLIGSAEHRTGDRDDDCDALTVAGAVASSA